MMEKAYNLKVNFESDDIEDIIASVDQLRHELAEGDRTFGIPAKTKGTWELTEKVRCEHCHGAGEVATDEDDGEGHIMRGVNVEKCLCRER